MCPVHTHSLTLFARNSKYLRDVLQHRLRQLLPSHMSVLVSKTDRDPLETM